MAFTFRAKTDTDSAAALSLTLSLPVGVAVSDLLVAWIARDDATDPTSEPAGWALVGRRSNGTHRTHVYWKVAATSEPTSFTWRWATGVPMAGGILAYMDALDPVLDVSASQANGSSGSPVTSHVAPSVTTTKANALVLCLYGTFRLAGAQSWTPPAGTTERVDRGTAARPSIHAADFIQATAGATGSKTATSATAAYGSGWQVAFIERFPDLLPPLPAGEARPAGGWFVHLLDTADNATPRVAFADFLSLSFSRALMESGQIEMHLPRDAAAAQQFSVGRQFNLYRGTRLMSLGVITDRIWTPASVRIMAQTQEYLLTGLGLPPEVAIFETWDKIGPPEIQYNRPMHLLLDYLRRPWQIEPFAKSRWNECTITGGALNTNEDLSASGVTLTVETPWIDLGAAGGILDHIFLLMTRSNAVTLTAGLIQYATSATPGTPSWVTIATFGENAIFSAGDTNSAFMFHFTEPTTLSLLRYVKAKVSLTTSATGQTWYELALMLRKPTALISKSATYWPTSSPSVTWTTLEEWQGKTLLAILNEIALPSGYEWRLMTTKVLELYTLPGYFIGQDRRRQLVLVWGDNIAEGEWVRESDRRVANRVYVRTQLPTTGTDIETGDEDKFKTIAVSEGDTASETKLGIHWQIFESAPDALEGARGVAKNIVAAQRDPSTEIQVEVVALPGIDVVEPGDIVTLVVPEHSVRMPVRIVAVNTQVGVTEQWALTLSAALKSPFGPPTVPDPNPDQIRRVKPPRTDLAFEITDRVEKVR